MCKVREATIKDIPQLLELGRVFFEYSPYSNMFEYDEDSVADTVEQLINFGIALVAEQDGIVIGCMLGFVVPQWYNRHKKSATEFAWFVYDEYRGSSAAIKLYKEFERKADEKGVDLLVLSDLCVNGTFPAGKLFNKLGLQVVERSHVSKRK